MVTLRNALKDAAAVPVVLLDGAAAVDWLYPHMAWRPVSDLRLAVRGGDGAAFAEAVSGGMKLARTGDEGRTAVFSDGQLELTLQEGLWPGGPEDEPLFARAVPLPGLRPDRRPARRWRRRSSARWATSPWPGSGRRSSATSTCASCSALRSTRPP